MAPLAANIPFHFRHNSENYCGACRRATPAPVQSSGVPRRATPQVAFLARPAGLEPATSGLEIHCSIQLSYGRSMGSSVVRKMNDVKLT